IALINKFSDTVPQRLSLSLPPMVITVSFQQRPLPHSLVLTVSKLRLASHSTDLCYG
ncbi:hypothetical protein A2U01_0066509, partial [Trifolium medium]|nr:hypothetical protein [Trifolium medium]